MDTQSLRAATAALAKAANDFIEELEARDEPAPAPATCSQSNPLRLYTVADASDLLGMSAEWVRREIIAGRLPAVEFGSGRSKRRVRATDLETFVTSRTFGVGK